MFSSIRWYRVRIRDSGIVTDQRAWNRITGSGSSGDVRLCASWTIRKSKISSENMQ